MDEYHGPQLYMIEPSGEYWVRATDERNVDVSWQGYRACAIGKGKQLAKTEIEKLDLDALTMREAVFEASKMYFFHFCRVIDVHAFALRHSPP